ncbi:hypothetical protein [Herbidospora yilanensis]|uniref:hypothetical protein n=1 Tax=Herbidospora yilanensis TaxID=354426 RepID=UPI0007824D15|nr:hypothetical protein [Herbidospora yilanensis]
MSATVLPAAGLAGDASPGSTIRLGSPAVTVSPAPGAARKAGIVGAAASWSGDRDQWVAAGWAS